MDSKYLLFALYCLIVSCIQQKRDNPETRNPFFPSNISNPSTVGPTLVPLTSNPVLISDSSKVYPETVQIELHYKTKDIALKKIRELKWPGKHYLSDVKTHVKPKIAGRKLPKIAEPDFTIAKPVIKKAGYPTLKKISPLRHSENAMYDIQHTELRALDICWDKDGSAWVATGLEIAHLLGDHIASYGASQGGLSAVSNIKTDDSGNVWSAFKGAGYFNGKYFYSFGKEEGFTDSDVYTMFKDSRGRMWFGTRGAGAICYNGKGFFHYGKKQGLRSARVSAIGEDKKGNMWFGTEGGGVFKFDGQSFIEFSFKEGLPTTYVYSIFCARNGELWFGHYPGALTRLRNDTLTVYDFGPEMNSTVFGLNETEKGNILVGTVGSGLLRYDGDKFEKIDKEAGLKEITIMKIAADPQQNIWALGNQINRLRISDFSYIPIPGTQGVYTIDKNKRVILDLDKYTFLDNKKAVTYSAIGFKTTGIARDEEGRLWFTNWCEGIGILDGDRIKSAIINGKTNWGCYSSIGNGLNGEIWFQSWTYGLVHLKKGKLISYMNNPAFADLGGINASYCQPDGTMWFGANNSELIKYDGNNFYRFPDLDKSLKKHGSTGINEISADEQGNLLISSLGAGMISYDGKSFRLHSDGDFKIGTGAGADPTETGTQTFLKTDKEGRIWAILNGKLTCITKGKRLQFGSSDGFLFVPVSFSFEKDGKMWFSNEEMTGSVNVEHLLEVKKSPVVTITNLNIFQQEIDFRSLQDSIAKGKSWLLQDVNVNLGKLKFDSVQNFRLLPSNIIFPYKANQLSFIYGTTDLNIQSNVKFSYFLEGYDKAWSVPSEDRIANYKNLDQGDYIFKVKAKLVNGEFGEICSYNFKITPPWWHTWWARLGYVIMTILLIILYNRWRIASFRQRQEELEMEVEVATAEIRKQKDEAEIQREKAERSEQFKQQFLANMSHEIRTPMNAVMGMTNLVLNTPLKEKQKFYLERIKKSGDNLLHIINDILDLSKIEAGKMELEQIDFSLLDMLDQVKQTLNHRAEEKGLSLLANIGQNVPDIVLGDPSRLNQILINIAGNAIKFTETGSVSIDVTREPEGIRFSVTDTGIGIPQDKLETVFENFSQANASDTRKYGGTGLGLSISRQLVEMMGGAISIESKVGYGTTFSFVLQLEEGSAERLQQRATLENSVDGSILDGLKILLTDDNEYNRIVAKDTLISNCDVEIQEATNGQEAIEWVKQMQFDVILMDVQMPGMNGFEATRFIRANLGSPANQTPVIALTASVLRTDLDKCKQAGMNSYIPKPFSSQQLITGIAQVLNIGIRVKNENKGSSHSEHSMKVTDLTYLEKFCEGDLTRMKKYILMFTSSVPAFIEKLNLALSAGDFIEIASQVHGFKTRWIMMGMTDTKDLAQYLEQLCREGSDEGLIRSNLDLLIKEVGIALIELENQ